jgi:hypothetical protein
MKDLRRAKPPGSLLVPDLCVMQVKTIQVDFKFCSMVCIVKRISSMVQRMSRESVERFRGKDMRQQIAEACRVNPFSRDMF